MSRERPRFRRERASSGPPLWGLTAMLVILGVIAFSRPVWAPRLPEGRLITVRGDVPHPGTYLASPPTVGEVVRLAGGESDDLREVPAGHGVLVHSGHAAIEAAADPLLVGLPVNVNHSGGDAIAAIPGIGGATAKAIVADRDSNGLFYAVGDLLRVPGIGPAKLEELRPFVTVGAPGERPKPTPLNLNAATASQLETLPGIGPVMAARIVVDRADNGPYTSIDDLRRVRGIGPRTVEKLRERVEVR